MKNNIVKPSQAVMQAFYNLYHSGDELKNFMIYQEEPVQKVFFNIEPKYLLVYKLNLNSIKEKNFEISSPIWMLYDGSKGIFAEYSEEGNLLQFYKQNTNTVEMEATIERFGVDPNKKTAILKLEGLDQSFVWFGESLPDPSPEDTFVLFGYAEWGIEKNVPLKIDRLLELSSIAVKSKFSADLKIVSYSE